MHAFTPHSDSNGPIVLALEGVSAGYRAGEVLSDVSLTLRAGELAIVTGPPASGKSTLIHLLRLALRARGGSFEILDANAARLSDAARASLRRRIGYVGANPVLVEPWSAFANIALPLKLAGRRRAAYAEDVHDLLGYVGLGAVGDEPVARLSAVERRRVALARALATKPDILLADDPVAGMASDPAQRLLRAMAELRRVGAAVVITADDARIADAYEPRRYALHNGRLAETHATEASE